ncbi:MAG: thioredoxin domain-containing protein, partial [Chloroflexi bacterium]|nr:thioredoxin domain-containing protein [Chloroflexota bacterium]
MFRFSPNPNRANLVNWREWGQEAFKEAHQQDRLVMLYIGAFWCGFCQGMDETTLSNDETITLLNAYFIPIRVENAQRPDIDARYNQDGWPSIAFITPQGHHMGTVNYMPPDEFCNVLVHLYQTYQAQKAEIQASASQQASPTTGSNQVSRLRTSAVSEISTILMELADPVN